MIIVIFGSSIINYILCIAEVMTETCNITDMLEGCRFYVNTSLLALAHWLERLLSMCEFLRGHLVRALKIYC